MSLIIALLPKCPFCIMAYTSAITVCSAKSLTEYQPGWTSYISISLMLVTLLLVLWNYKGMKTLFASLLIASGGYFILQSELYSGLLNSYYCGNVLLFVGIWVNGNLSYFIRLFDSPEKRLVQHG